MPREAPYLDIADRLRSRVEAGEWATGERLPSRAALAVEYDVGRNVTQRAVDRLIAEGLLEGRAGSGTYVRTPRERGRVLRSRAPEGTGGPEPLPAGVRHQDGRDGMWEFRSQARVPAPRRMADRLAIGVGDLCVVTWYEFLTDDGPAQLSVSWEPLAITDGSPVMLPESGPYAGAGVVERMRTLGVDVRTAVEVPRPARADREAAGLLGVAVGDLLTVIERTYYDAARRPVETCDITVPDSRWEVAYEITCAHRAVEV